MRVAVRLRPRTAEDLVTEADFADCVEIQPEVTVNYYQLLLCYLYLKMVLLLVHCKILFCSGVLALFKSVCCGTCKYVISHMCTLYNVI